MFPYIILLLLPIISTLLQNRCLVRIGNKTYQIDQKIVLGSFMLFFLCMLMFRGTKCGSDTGGYIEFFYSYNKFSFMELISQTQSEVGYNILNKVIGSFVSNPQFLLMVTSCICILPIWYFYLKESEMSLLTVALFVSVAPFSMYFSGIRQAIAMAFVVPAWYCAKNKKWLWFIIVVFLAMQFHTSAFIIAVIYPLYHAHITAKWLFAVIPAMGIVYVFNNPIFSFLLQFLWDDYSSATETDATTVLILLILFAVYCFLIPDEASLEKDVIGMRNILLFTIVIQSFAPVHTLSMRMNYYFLPFIPVLIPKIANRSSVRFSEVAKLSVSIMTVFFIFYFYWRAFTGNDPLSIYPYVPFWQ